VAAASLQRQRTQAGLPPRHLGLAGRVLPDSSLGSPARSGGREFFESVIAENIDMGRPEHDEVNHVGEVVCGAESAGVVLGHAYEPVDSFGYCAGEAADGGNDSVPVRVNHAHELAQWLDAAELRALAPALEELLGAADVGVAPKMR
jgi:hypothetical protein